MNAAEVGPSLFAAKSTAASLSEATRWWLLAAGLLTLLLINLGNRGLNEPDEGRYSNIAVEMLEAGHGWWEPRMSDFAHYDKPPMTYWLAASAFKFFGPTEGAARLPPLLGAVMTLAGLGWAAWRRYGSRTAWWAVLFCGTMGQFWVLGRMLTPDMLLTGFSTLAVGCWAEERHRQNRGRWWWGCVLFATLAWWTKATAALVPLLGLTVGLLATRDQAGLAALRPLRLLLLILVAGSPWYLSLLYLHPELKHFFFGRELAGRIVGHPDGRQGPIYYHVAFSLIAWMPWWPAALAALVRRRNEIKERWRHQHWRAIPLEAWIMITGLTIFSLISSKLVTYTLPLAPWAALFCARVLMGQPDEQLRRQQVRRVLGTAAACAAIFVTATFVLPRWESRLGVGSTLREVARALHQRNAAVVYLDRYAAGAEFYFGESVFYVTKQIPRQRPSDTGICEELGESHFVMPVELSTHLARQRTNGLWFVRYKGRTNSPLAIMLQQATTHESLRIGDFVLDSVTVSSETTPESSRSPLQHPGPENPTAAADLQ
jgi:4-amino-4-deoxy-L-arabinose transferase-like glycosyltransferase